ncbi:hypothetical protein [Actinomadura hibisca]|uniref:hypothetical protein n=1 Tax=Actinomadura hibisca TaxID=68565 RepID=UPI0008333771|nr:hypothetical protein [Actinomadura hibisca]
MISVISRSEAGRVLASRRPSGAPLFSGALSAWSAASVTGFSRLAGGAVATPQVSAAFRSPLEQMSHGSWLSAQADRNRWGVLDSPWNVARLSGLSSSVLAPLAGQLTGLFGGHHLRLLDRRAEQWQKLVAP